MMNKLNPLFTVAALLGSPACMFAPFDGQVVSATTTAVSFSGSDYQASRNIQIQGYDWNDRTFRTIQQVAPDPTPRAYDGSDWFLWQTSRSVPARYWANGRKGGQVARIRAARTAVDGTPTGGLLTTVERDYASCAEANGNSVGRFLSRCASPNSPEAHIFTSAYPRTVDMVAVGMYASPLGTTIDVENAGRKGRITRVECVGASRAIAAVRNDVLGPTERISIRVNLVPFRGERVQCTVFAEDMAGNPEPVACINTGGTVTCGDNSISRRF